jgi:hypothetical protein
MSVGDQSLEHAGCVCRWCSSYGALEVEAKFFLDVMPDLGIDEILAIPLNKHTIRVCGA